MCWTKLKRLDNNMPVYTIHNNETNETYDVTMKYDALQIWLKENPECEHVFKMPATVSGRMSTQRMAGSGWQDVLQGVKKASGKNNSINV